MKNSQSNVLRESVADSLDGDVSIQRYLPELLQWMWALGSAEKCILDMVRSLNLPFGIARALDLGCGKRAVLIRLAPEFGLQGVDRFESSLGWQDPVNCRNHNKRKLIVLKLTTP